MFDRISSREFLVIGRVGMDLSPDPPGTRAAEATQMTAVMGGSSANIAAGLARQGCGAALLSCVSDDAVGAFCLNQLDAYGIDRRHVRAVQGEARTSLAVSETRMIGHQTVIYRNNAADFLLGTEDVEAVDYTRFGAVVATGTAFAAEPSRTATFRAFGLARAAGVPVVLDLDYRPYSWPSPAVAAEVLGRAAAGAAMVVGNDDEFGVLAGSHEGGLARARALAAAGALVIYKRGAEGAITLAGGAEQASGIFRVEALKPTGAGDGFLAGLLAALSQGRPLAEAVARGSATAAIVVSRPGCAPAMPTIAELDAFLAAHPGPTRS